MTEYRDLSARPKKVVENDEVVVVPPAEIKEDCIKCGWHEASFEFNPKGIEKSKEEMLLTCLRCGYTWTDKPLDHVKLVHRNLDDPKRHNIAGDMNKPAGGYAKDKE